MSAQFAKAKRLVLASVLDNAQAAVAAYAYDEFGALLLTSGTLDQPFRFSTKPYDPQTGLSYYGYRFYAPPMGRWLNRDPIGVSGGINLYAFVGNNPVNLIDPDGLRTYSEQETSVKMDKVRDQNIFQAAWNHSGGRQYDFKMNDLRDDGVRNDTYTLNGVTMNSDQFGNFAAGYAGYNTGWFVGLEGVLWGGIMYDYLDARAKNFNDAVFDWDKDSWPDIMAGAYYARYGKMPPCY